MNNTVAHDIADCSSKGYPAQFQKDEGYARLAGARDAVLGLRQKIGASIDDEFFLMIEKTRIEIYLKHLENAVNGMQRLAESAARKDTAASTGMAKRLQQPDVRNRLEKICAGAGMISQEDLGKSIAYFKSMGEPAKYISDYSSHAELASFEALRAVLADYLELRKDLDGIV